MHDSHATHAMHAIHEIHELEQNMSGPYAGVQASYEHDARLEDYLDDKLQSRTDLENLHSLLASIEYQHTQLQSQLDHVSRELEEARRSAEEQQSAVVSQINDFQKLQHKIDVRLRILAASDAPDEAIRRLEMPMSQLHKVDLACQYLGLLQHVDRLRKDVRCHLPENPRLALEPYTRLKQLSMQLGEEHGPPDGAAVHLMSHVRLLTDRLWDEMKERMRREMEVVLEKRDWPKVDRNSQVDDEWLACFEKVVDLQLPELLHSPVLVSLLPVDVMAQIFIKEFRFHFMSDKMTSMPQTIASHCFPWLLDLVEKWEDFLRHNFGPVLACKLIRTGAAVKTAYVDPACALITCMLPVMREKIESVMAEAVRDPVFYSSLMSQLMALDERIRSDYNYDGGDVDKGWPGLTADILSKHFEAWLKAEKDFALGRYKTIMTAADARNIDYDFSGPGKTKPTVAATRVTDLLRSVTSQYEGVRRFSHKLRFLIDIQLAILDEYHDHLRGMLEAYLSTNSTVGRAFGVTKEQVAALDGTGGLELLCKVYGSAEHVVSTLQDWSNEEFFVTLWEQLQARAKGSQDETNLAGGMSYEHVRDRTSSAVGTEEDGGILFDETIAAYSQRRRRAQEFLSDAVVEAQRKAFRPYLSRPQWTTVAEDAIIDPHQLSITPELDEPLEILERDLGFLAKTLGTAVYRTIWRHALEKVNDMLWGDVLMSQTFTTLGAAQLRRDLDAINTLVERHIPGGSVALGSLGDAVRFLNLPVEAEGPESVSLKQAGHMVYTNNAEAKKLLDMLDMDLTPANARHILQRRVEAQEI